MNTKAIALIPARSGSKRIVNKNIKPLNGHPLIAYSIRAAIESKVFDKVVCVTDDKTYASVAQYYGAEVPRLRPKEISGDKSFDIEWVQWILSDLLKVGESYDLFSILRPTNPFRLPSTIQRAWNLFLEEDKADSLRAVQKVTEHPGKMWLIDKKRMFPLLPFQNDGVPWHSSQYTSLPEVYVQNASLEIAWTKVALQSGSIAGNSIIPFVSEGLEGFDINNPEDWILAEHFIDSSEAKIVDIQTKPFKIV
jgi:CMP-N,N'-diacetyllegionaminic acid synthase